MAHLNFETLGDASKPAIMLLHGFMSSNSQWLMNSETLSQHYHLVMVELWGHGDSPLSSEDDQYSVDAYVSEFEAIRRQLRIPNWAVIGQSYGAGLVLRYAMAHPDFISHVVVTNSRSAFGAVDSSDRPSKGANMAETDLRKLPFHPIHARRFPEHVKKALVEAADNMQPDAVRLSGRLGGGLNCVELLNQVAAPILLTNGVFEKSFQNDLAQLVERYPRLNVVDLQGGHSVNIEAHLGFNTAVVEFLST